MKRIVIASAVLAGLAGFAMAPHASAATAGTTMGLSGTVVTACTVGTTAVAFGTVAVGAVTNGTAGNVAVTCTSGGTYDVGLDAGANALGGSNRLKNGSNFLNYGLFQDSGYATAWGNTVGTNTLHGTGTGSEQDLPVYGAIPSGQTLVSGTGSLAYSDTVNVTVTY
jgi:spore coat protein U-like protein